MAALVFFSVELGDAPPRLHCYWVFPSESSDLDAIDRDLDSIQNTRKLYFGEEKAFLI